MFKTEVVRCSGVDHKIKCLEQVIEAVDRTKHGNNVRNGRKVTIRGAITDPCTCHLDALLWIVHEIRSDGYFDSSDLDVAYDGVRTLGYANRMH